MLGDQLYMDVCLWYPVKSEWSNVRMYSSIHWTGHLLQGTGKTRPCLSGQVVSQISNKKWKLKKVKMLSVKKAEI